jgi:hypothetical protein
MWRVDLRIVKLYKGKCTMSKKTPDPISSWFIAGEQLGEYIGIRFGRVAPGAADPEWIFLRHTDFDGIGGLAELLRRRGAAVDRLPQIKYPLGSSRMQLLRAVPRYLSPRQRIEWGPLKRGTASNDNAQPPAAVAWHLFDEDATTRVRRVCRRSGVTVNSFLLKHLTKAIRPFLADQSSVVPWMIPVNLRGKVDRGRDTANHTSYVAVKVSSYEMVHDVHRSIYAALARGEHWANWQVYQLGRFITAGMRRYVAASDWAFSQWNLGGFSNLGDWDPERRITQADCMGGWLFCPPVLRCQVVGAGCVTFQNRLSLTVQAHPNLTNDPEVVKAWVQDWVKEVEIDLASVLAPAAARRPD